MVAEAARPISLHKRRVRSDESWYLLGFADWCSRQDMANKTVFNYYHDMTLFARWYRETYGVAMRPEEVTAAAILDYKRYMRQEQRYAPSTVNRKIAALRTFYRCMQAVGFMDNDPTATAKQIRREVASPQGLSRNEKNALLRVCESQGNKRNTAMICLMLYGGLRVGEVARLDLRDVELSPPQGLDLHQGQQRR